MPNYDNKDDVVGKKIGNTAYYKYRINLPKEVVGQLNLLDKELKVTNEFWDFLGGKGAYQDLLSCFEQAGIELRPEIDEYFAKFSNNK